MKNEKMQDLILEVNKRKTKNSMFKRYEITKGNELYILYYIYNNKLYRTITNTINSKFIKLDRTSKKKGSKKQLKLTITKEYKEILVKDNTTQEIMTKQEFEVLCEEHKIDLVSKGRTIEYIEYTRQGRQNEYKVDNVRYDKQGDINIKGIEYQIKFENASITTYNTIDKVVNEKLANANI